MNATDWRIPPSVTRWFAEMPPDAPVAVLLRHSVRDHLPPGEAGYGIPITPVGAALARELGALVGSRLRTLHASPLPRCVQTAKAIRAGAAADIPVVRDHLLGDPGVYVIDDERGGRNWKERGYEGVMAHLVSQDRPLPGMADPAPAARFLVRHMLAIAGNRSGLHLFITHDSVVTATAARLLGEPLGRDAWPWYLEGAFFRRQGGHVVTAYRDRCSRSEAVRLACLDERSVVDFARWEVTRAVGPGCNARFFLAGGVFKALLTGRPPRDLDLWAPSARDRALVLNALIGRGARRLDARPFADAFEIDGRIVELPHKTDPGTLEGMLGRFDIALSAVGVEHRPEDRWRAVIHPLARTSIAQRQVLLLKPLVNWKWALTTLERMRRYASELRYTVPATEEAEVWRVFEAQSDSMQRKILENYQRTAGGGYGVREEGLRRLRWPQPGPKGRATALPGRRPRGRWRGR